MRVALVLQDLHDTGANRVSLDRACFWAKAGDEVTVFVVTYETADRRVPLPPGLHIERAISRPRRLRAALPAALWKLIRLSRRSDVLVAGTEIGFGLLFAWGAARLARRPFAVTVQSRADFAIDQYVDRWLRPLTRAALGHADLAVCVSHGLVTALLEVGPIHGRIVVVSNAVSRSAILAAAAAAAPVPEAAEHPVVVATGRLVHQKGFDLLLRAHASALAQGAPPHRLVILGEGDQRGALLHLAAELGVDQSVALPGFFDNPLGVVSTASLFVLSSRWEGLPLNLAEALACGTACLAFDCMAGPSEVLADGRYGRLVPSGDVDALAFALREHLLDPRPLSDKAQQAAVADLDLFFPDLAAGRHRAAVAQLVTDAGSPVAVRTWRAGGWLALRAAVLGFVVADGPIADREPLPQAGGATAGG